MKEKYIRQSFLGENSQEKIEQTEIAVVGFGGGGSHIGQQLLHIGFKKIKVFDADIVEDSNTHRLVGINYPDDVVNQVPKVEVAKRMAKSIQGEITIETYKTTWQENADVLKKCKIIVGCVDSFDQRDQLEVFCRRHGIIFVDIGMVVKSTEGEPPQMSGQVILSLPGHLCMRCMGFITDEKLNQDRSKYGDAGPQPQVIWANGVLASTAVGIVVNQVTGWTGNTDRPIYLSYNANTNELEVHPRLKYTKIQKCSHYNLESVGEPKFIDL